MDDSASATDNELIPTWAKRTALVDEMDEMQEVINDVVLNKEKARMEKNNIASTIQELSESVAAMQSRLNIVEQLLSRNPNLLFNKRNVKSTVIPSEVVKPAVTLK